MPAKMPEEQYQRLLDRVEELTGSRNTPYEEMLELAAEYNSDFKKGDPRKLLLSSKEPEKSIFAMGRNNDPFYGGVPSQLELAVWFAELHRQVARGRRLHLRFLFYLATGDEGDPETGERITTYAPDGETKLEKTIPNWEMFQDAAKFARNAELVDPALILESEKNVSVIENPPSSYIPALDIESSPPDLRLASAAWPGSRVTYTTARPRGYGRNSFSLDRDMVPSLIEIWSEKDLSEGDASIVKSVCRSEDVNLVTGTGFVTLSTTAAVLERQKQFDKPLRIIYLNDFDDAGLYMPVGPARHLEFAIRKMDPKPDIRLYQLAITPEQVLEQNLPTKIPRTAEEIARERERREKEEKKGPNYRQEKWEANLRQGLGIVQLNALTFPTRAGWFADTLRSAIQALRDPEILERFERTEQEAQDLLNEEIERRFRWPHRALELIGARADEVVVEVTSRQEEQRTEIARQRAELEAQLAELRSQKAELDREVEEELEPLEERAERVLGCRTPSPCSHAGGSRDAGSGSERAGGHC